VAWKVWPGCAVSLSIVSIRRTASVVPDGIVTFCGGGGATGAAGIAALAGAADIASELGDAAAEELSLEADGKACILGVLARGFSALAGLAAGMAGIGVISAAAGATVRLFTTCFTPGAPSA